MELCAGELVAGAGHGSREAVMGVNRGHDGYEQTMATAGLEQAKGYSGRQESDGSDQIFPSSTIQPSHTAISLVLKNTSAHAHVSCSCRPAPAPAPPVVSIFPVTQDATLTLIFCSKERPSSILGHSFSCRKSSPPLPPHPSCPAHAPLPPVSCRSDVNSAPMS